MLSIISDFKDYINNNFEGQIPNLIYFAFGIIIGIIFFLLAFLIVYLISKNKRKDKEINVFPINENYKKIIDNKKFIFENRYANEEIIKKLQGFSIIIKEMCEEIGLLYYPESNDPIFEVSLDQLVDVLQYCINRVEYITDKILVGKLGFAEIFTKKPLKDIKLKFIFEKIANPKKEEEKPTLFSKIKKKLFKAGTNVLIKRTKKPINIELLELINDLGEDLNLLYSKNEIAFNKKYKKIKKGSDINV